MGRQRESTPIEPLLQVRSSCCRPPMHEVGQYSCSQSCSNADIDAGEDWGTMSTQLSSLREFK